MWYSVYCFWRSYYFSFRYEFILPRHCDRHEWANAATAHTPISATSEHIITQKQHGSTITCKTGSHQDSEILRMEEAWSQTRQIYVAELVIRDMEQASCKPDGHLSSVGSKLVKEDFRFDTPLFKLRALCWALSSVCCSSSSHPGSQEKRIGISLCDCTPCL